MNHRTKTGILSFVLFSVLLAPLSILADDDSGFDNRRGANEVIGAVYTMTNAADGNDILVFARDTKGRLTEAGEFATGGLGTGAGLGNQGAVILDPANRWLFAVNPGSNTISVFEVMEDGLSLIDQFPSNGDLPVSLTYSHNVLYVLNAGGNAGTTDNITGFTVEADGMLTPLAGSTRALSADSTGPAQIQFNTDGDVLVITEKATDLIDTFTVDSAGLPSAAANTQVSAGPTPFGFAFGKRDQLFVSEAAGGADDQSSVSSYSLSKDGILTAVSSAVATTETAACWVVVSNDGRYAYTTNAGSGSISGYEIGFDGTIALLNKKGRTGLTGQDSAPIDMSLSNDGHNLYTLNSGNDTISVFRVEDSGKLERMQTFNGLPDGANGLAAR